ncbi:MAG: hypothetical protein M1383_05900 [Patescibacteria group bacterium]|nr:hypothetical protein [Patescibacteria group bacterium]
MQNAAKRAKVRIPERASLLPEDWQADFMDPQNKARDERAIARIQSYNAGDLFGQVVATPGVTLNGQPVKLLVLGTNGQSRDLLDHPEMVRSVGRFEKANHQPKVDLDGLIKTHLAKRPVTVD